LEKSGMTVPEILDLNRKVQALRDAMVTSPERTPA
jgi:hypothetical protein